MMGIFDEKFMQHIAEAQQYVDKINGVSIFIEERDPNYVYLIHTTSLEEYDIKDIYDSGLLYSGSDLARTFNNLSRDWGGGTSWTRVRADQTSMEEVIVNKCKSGYDYQCFLHKIPLMFFEPVNDFLLPIPVWTKDTESKVKYNISSSKVNYNMFDSSRILYRMQPSLLFGHYDLKTNTFNRNSNYSVNLDAANGIYDYKQRLSLYKYCLCPNLVEHNNYIMEGTESPFSGYIRDLQNNLLDNADLLSVVPQNKPQTLLKR